MVRITVYRNDYHDITKFSVEGHANADDFGRDIVCASISILAQTSVLALYELLNIDIKYELEDGWLYCELPDSLDKGIREKANIIMDTMVLGIKGTMGMYKEFIEFLDKEV